MNPRFYEDYRITIRAYRQWLPDEKIWRYRVGAFDDNGHELLGGQSFSGYDEAFTILESFLDGEIDRRQVLLAKEKTDA